MIYSLPPSHLPITKYVTVNAGDAVDLHRALCQTGKSSSVWYAEGSNQGGEGWGAAVEWNLDTGISGQKLRTCVGMTDSLGTELGAILKAVEGFYEQLKQSIRSNKPMSHEFILFCSSPAALVSIDTSARPEAIEFERLWREICTDFLHARMTLVRVAPSSDVEGHMLARKISDVAARNSFTKRRKERTIEDIYNRPGGDEPAPGASTVGGAWQRGDADPSHRKVPFDRPEPPVSPKPESKMRSRSRSTSRSRSRSRSPTPERNERSRSPLPAAPAPVSVQAPPEPEDEPLQPRSGALCVTQ
jgi:hypothetical protein